MIGVLVVTWSLDRMKLCGGRMVIAVELVRKWDSAVCPVLLPLLHPLLGLFFWSNIRSYSSSDLVFLVIVNYTSINGARRWETRGTSIHKAREVLYKAIGLIKPPRRRSQ